MRLTLPVFTLGKVPHPYTQIWYRYRVVLVHSNGDSYEMRRKRLNRLIQEKQVSSYFEYGTLESTLNCYFVEEKG